MFALETQLRETLNGVILGPAKYSARARFSPIVPDKSIVYSLASLQKRLYISEYLKEDDTRLSRWGHCHESFQWAKKGSDYHP